MICAETGNVMRVLLVAICLICAASAAQAGAWAREKGQLFIASASNIALLEDTDTYLYYDPTFYTEYGLSDRVTLGAEYFTTQRDTVQTGLVFANIPLGDMAGDDRFSVGLAFGAEIRPYQDPVPLMRGGLSWGRGLDSGWLAIDASATYHRDADIFTPKADFTWGYNLTDRWTLMFQLQTGRSSDAADYAKLNSAVIFGLTDTLRITMGVMNPLIDDDPAALRLGVWQTF